MTSQYIPELVERVAWVAPMTTLADEIARAAVLEARGGVYWLKDASDGYWRWLHAWEEGDRLKSYRWYARGLLDSRSTTPLHAPRKPPQQPQAPEGGMMGEMW